jgi:hypothetical protein
VQPPVQGRQPQQVVGAVGHPGGEAVHPQPVDLRDAAVQAQAGHRPGGGQPGLQPDLDVPPAQQVGGVAGHLRADLGQDTVRRFHQDPPHVPGAELGVARAGAEGHVLQFGQRLHPGVAAAGEHERQGRAADVVRGGGGRGVEPTEHVVAQVDGLADGLEADPGLRQARDGKNPGDRPRREHQQVIADRPLRTVT